MRPMLLYFSIQKFRSSWHLQFIIQKIEPDDVVSQAFVRENKSNFYILDHTFGDDLYFIIFRDSTKFRQESVVSGKFYRYC